MDFIVLPLTVRNTMLYFYAFFIIYFLSLCDGERIRYLSTERPKISYFNPKYVKYANITSRRFSRRDPFYYVDMHLEMIYPMNNNVSVHYIIYEHINNGYRPTLEMHFKLCDLVAKDNFFGSALRQGKLAKGCPFPAGRYHLYNMTIPVKQIPEDFPVKNGRIFCNLTATHTAELLGNGYIDMDLKTKNI